MTPSQMQIFKNNSYPLMLVVDVSRAVMMHFVVHCFDCYKCFCMHVYISCNVCIVSRNTRYAGLHVVRLWECFAKYFETIDRNNSVRFCYGLI